MSEGAEVPIPLSDLSKGVTPQKESHRKNEYETIAAQIQERTGTVANVSTVRVRRGLLGNTAGASVIELGGGERQALVTLPDEFRSKREEAETVAHEMTHVLLDQRFKMIWDKQISQPISEAVCDLVGIDVADQISGGNLAQSIAANRAEDYKDFKGRATEVDGYFSSAQVAPGNPESLPTDSVQEDIGHVIGGRFAYTIKAALPETPVSTMVNCMLEDPPTKEELLNPELYIPKVRAYNKGLPSVTPAQVTVTDRSLRLI